MEWQRVHRQEELVYQYRLLDRISFGAMVMPASGKMELRRAEVLKKEAYDLTRAMDALNRMAARAWAQAVEDAEQSGETGLMTGLIYGTRT